MKKVLVSIMLFILIFSLTGCKEKSSEGDILKSKVTEELKVMESKILDMLNNCNNISMRNYKVVSEKVENRNQEPDKSQSESSSEQSSEGESSESAQSEEQKSVSDTILSGSRDTNWNDIKNCIEILNEIWATAIEDLYKCDVNKEDILKFSENINSTIIGIKNSDKANTVQSLINLYSYIPKFANNVYQEDEEKNKINAKYHILNAYTKIETEEWEEINKELNEAEKYVTNVINNIYQGDENIKKLYVNLKEFQNSIKNHDKDVLYIKYKILIEDFR